MQMTQLFKGNGMLTTFFLSQSKRIMFLVKQAGSQMHKICEIYTNVIVQIVTQEELMLSQKLSCLPEREL